MWEGTGSHNLFSTAMGTVGKTTCSVGFYSHMVSPATRCFFDPSLDCSFPGDLVEANHRQKKACRESLAGRIGRIDCNYSQDPEGAGKAISGSPEPADPFLCEARSHASSCLPREMTAQGTFPDLTPSLLTHLGSEFLFDQPMSKGQLRTKVPASPHHTKGDRHSVVLKTPVTVPCEGQKDRDFCTLCSSQHEQSEPIALGFGVFCFFCCCFFF